MTTESESIQLDIVATIADFAGFFDVLEVWRSLDGTAGPYLELTAGNWSPARLPRDGGDRPTVPVTGASAALVGKALIFLLDAADTLAIIFTGTDPLTRGTAASQITAKSGGRLSAYVDAVGRLVVETVEPGATALIELVDGTAAADLGLTVGSLAYGKEPRLQLVNDQELYRFTDPRSQDGAFYKTRYRNGSTGATSDFSQPFSAEQASAITDQSIAIGKADLVDLRGRPLAFRSVLIHTEFNGVLVEGKAMAGGDLDVISDADGHVEVALVRGQKISVAIAGTDLVRDLIVPTDLAVLSFNLFDPTLAGADIFRVQVPQIIYAERRSL